MLSHLSDRREGAWSLDDFVEQANLLLPHVLPKDASKRAAESVNQRLVRHYATQGLLDEPLREGREARYLYRHLLQLLVVRRLLAEGLSAAVIGRALEGRTDAELEGLLTDQLRLDLVPRGHSSERDDFLKRVRERAGLDAPRAEAGPGAVAGRQGGAAASAMAATPPSPDPASFSPFRESSWTRVEIME